MLSLSGYYEVPVGMRDEDEVKQKFNNFIGNIGLKINKERS
jgi:hypothetical protein